MCRPEGLSTPQCCATAPPSSSRTFHRPAREPCDHETACPHTGRAPPSSFQSLSLWICLFSSFFQMNEISEPQEQHAAETANIACEHGKGCVCSKNVLTRFDNLCEQRQSRRHTDTYALIICYVHTFKITSVEVQYRRPKTLNYIVSLQKNHYSSLKPSACPSRLGHASNSLRHHFGVIVDATTWVHMKKPM